MTPYSGPYDVLASLAGGSQLGYVFSLYLQVMEWKNSARSLQFFQLHNN